MFNFSTNFPSCSMLLSCAPWPSSPHANMSTVSSQHSIIIFSSARRGLQSKQRQADVVLQRSGWQPIRVGANANAPQGKGTSKDDVRMVDPLEAKRLAAKQMQEIKAREKLKRQRRIEAINGAWAMIGLTAGLVVEGQTGNGILAQIAGYFSSIIHFLFQ